MGLIKKLKNAFETAKNDVEEVNDKLENYGKYWLKTNADGAKSYVTGDYIKYLAEAAKKGRQNLDKDQQFVNEQIDKSPAPAFVKKADKAVADKFFDLGKDITTFELGAVGGLSHAPVDFVEGLISLGKGAYDVAAGKESLSDAGRGVKNYAVNLAETAKNAAKGDDNAIFNLGYIAGSTAGQFLIGDVGAKAVGDRLGKISVEKYNRRFDVEGNPQQAQNIEVAGMRVLRKTRNGELKGIEMGSIRKYGKGAENVEEIPFMQKIHGKGKIIERQMKTLDDSNVVAMGRGVVKGNRVEEDYILFGKTGGKTGSGAADVVYDFAKKTGRGEARGVRGFDLLDYNNDAFRIPKKYLSMDDVKYVQDGGKVSVWRAEENYAGRNSLMPKKLQGSTTLLVEQEKPAPIPKPLPSYNTLGVDDFMALTRFNPNDVKFFDIRPPRFAVPPHIESPKTNTTKKNKQIFDVVTDELEKQVLQNDTIEIVRQRQKTRTNTKTSGAGKWAIPDYTHPRMQIPEITRVIPDKVQGTETQTKNKIVPTTGTAAQEVEQIAPSTILPLEVDQTKTKKGRGHAGQKKQKQDEEVILGKKTKKTRVGDILDALL